VNGRSNKNAKAANTPNLQTTRVSRGLALAPMLPRMTSYSIVNPLYCKFQIGKFQIR
jgi:hypothetical protein